MKEILSMHYVCTHDEALKLIQEQKEFWVSNCGCRENKGDCKRSRMDVCLMFNGEEDSSGSNMHQITIDEVISIMQEAETKKLVTRPFRSEDRNKTEGICFCCDDCCGYFLNEDEECDKGQFIEKTDMNVCVHCGACIPVCYFDARKMVDGCLEVDRNECYGCGLCPEVCPARAIEMLKRT
jgi:Pyruvate/2-oxoacid:ferredoxin oxidoreductase delta subunit